MSTPCPACHAEMVTLRDYVDVLHQEVLRMIAIERDATTARFEALLREQRRQFQDRVAHEKLEQRVLEVERQAATLTAKLGVTIALVSVFFGALQIVLHLIQPS